MTSFSEVELSINDSFEKRQVRFLSYLFLNLESNNYYNGFNPSYNLNKLGNGRFNLVLDRSVIHALQK